MALPSACAVPRRLVSMQRVSRAVSRVLYRSLIAGTTQRCVTRTPTADPTRRTIVILNHLCLFSSHSKMSYTIEERGAPNTTEYRLFFKSSNGSIVSPFHDIPLYATADQSNNEFNMVVEIPRWTNAKMEISKDEKMNPIKQDTKKGKLRFVKNIFPHHGYIWNYGAFPQTWEDPSVVFPETNTKGDVDPLDVCEIGQKVHKRGAVVRVKVLGTMCLIDEGETDWKVIAIDVTDPLAAELNDVKDVDEKMPGFLKATYEWFKFYKVPDGKPENKFAFDGKAKDKEYALGVVKEAYEQWKKLMPEPNDCGIACENTCVGGSKFMIPAEEALKYVEQTQQTQQSQEFAPDVDKWYYPIQ